MNISVSSLVRRLERELEAEKLKSAKLEIENNRLINLCAEVTESFNIASAKLKELEIREEIRNTAYKNFAPSTV